MNGVDLSNNNVSVDWRGVEFAFYKATEGVSFVDQTQPKWATHQIPDGPYHFAHFDVNSPEAEAGFFLKHAIPGVMWGLDCETRGDIDPLAIMGTARLTAACDRFFELVSPVLGPNGYHYTFRHYASSLWPGLRQPWGWWLASAAGKPTYTSYAGRTVNIEQWGIQGGVDRDIAYTPLVKEDSMTPEQWNFISGWINNITPVIQSQIANAINDPNAGVQIKLDHLAAQVAALEAKIGTGGGSATPMSGQAQVTIDLKPQS